MNFHDNQSGGSQPVLGEDLNMRRRGDWWLFLGLLLLFVGAAAAILAVRPAYHRVKTVRAQKLARSVSDSLEAGAGTNALTDVRLMLSLAPDDELVLRAAARYCTTNHHAEAVTYWEMLLQLVPGTPEDHLAFARTSMDQGRYDVATRELARLLQRPGGNADAARLSLLLALKRGAWEMAARMAEHVLQLDPGDDQTQLWRGLALLRTGQPVLVAEGTSSLLALMFRPDGKWRETIDVLLEAPGLTPGELSLIRHRVREAMTNTVTDQLRLLSVEWLLKPEERGPVIAQALQLVAPSGRAAEVAEAGRWLLARGVAQPLLDLFPPERSRGDPVKMQLRVLALARLGKWEQVAAVADDPGSGLDVHVALLMSVAAASLGPAGSSQRDVQAVLAQRDLKLPELLEALRLAEENGLNEAAIYLLEPLLENPATLPEAANRILALSHRVERVALRRHALDRLVHAYPSDSLALQELGYVEAVLPWGDLEVVDRVERLPDAATNRFTQLICALGEIRRGRTEAALARLSAVARTDGVEDYRMHIAFAAAYGGGSESRRHAALADQGPLQVEERALISSWLPPKPR